MFMFMPMYATIRLILQTFSDELKESQESTRRMLMFALSYWLLDMGAKYQVVFRDLVGRLGEAFFFSATRLSELGTLYEDVLRT